MAQDTSITTIALALAFLEREAGPVAVADVLHELGDVTGALDQGHWVDWATKVRTFEAVARVVGDPRVGERLGRSALEARVGHGIRAAARSVGSPRLLYAQAPRVAAKFCSTHRFEVVVVGQETAVLRHRDASGVGYHRIDCDYNVGLLRTGPELFGLRPARVEHVTCGVDGADACEYRVSWTARRPRHRARRTAGLGLGVAAAASSVAVAIGGVAAVPATAALAAAAGAVVSRAATGRHRRELDRVEGRLAAEHSAMEQTIEALRHVSEARSLSSALDRVGAEAMRALGARDFAIVLTHEGGGERCQQDSGLPEPVGRALELWAATRPVAEPTVLDELVSVPELECLHDAGFRSACVAPLRYQSQGLGYVVALSRHGAAFFADDARLLGVHAGHAAVALQNARLVERMEHLATHDPLTGLLNEQAFTRMLERELARREDHEPISVILLQLPGVGRLVDDTGTERADRVIRTAATIVEAHRGPAGVVARISAGRFSVMLLGADLNAARQCAETLSHSVSAETGQDCRAGVASCPDHATELGDLLECAAGALDGACASCSGTVVAYDAWTTPTRSGRAQRAQIRAAIEATSAITPVYQPIVNVADLHTAGYEALTRFPTSTRRPDEWFEQAQRVGMSAELEARCAELSLASASPWPGAYLSINASPTALRSTELWAALPADLSDIVVEVTEREVFGAGSELEDALARVRRRGGRIALDDAGSGYAGLQQLVRVRPDIVKLDRALISGLDEDETRRSLVEALTSFALSIGADVCAEGVERQEELAALRRLGVTYAQGYLLGRPAPASAPAVVPVGVPAS